MKSINLVIRPVLLLEGLSKLFNGATNLDSKQFPYSSGGPNRVGRLPFITHRRQSTIRLKRMATRGENLRSGFATAPALESNSMAGLKGRRRNGTLSST